MQVLLDKNGFFTGNYSKKGTFLGGVNVNSIPDTGDRYKDLAHKLINGSWVFDETRYQELIDRKDNEQVGIFEESTVNVKEKINNLTDVYFDIVDELA